MTALHVFDMDGTLLRGTTAAIDPAGILSPADKVHLTEAERAAHGLPRHACVAYGDSMSDLPLFAVLQSTVAVNADAALERAARVAYASRRRHR
jgi:phosphoserine phosphatase